MDIIEYENKELSTEVVVQVQERLEAYTRAYSENTTKARESDFRVYSAWCKQHEINPIPASPQDIEAFLLDMAREVIDIKKTVDPEKPKYRPFRTVATISRYLATIKTMHDIRSDVYKEVMGDSYFAAENYANPANSTRVSLALRGIKRRWREIAQEQAKPIQNDFLITAFKSLGNSKRDLLHKALLSVAYETLMRRSELVNVEIENIEYDRDGSGHVLIPFSKTDQEGKGEYRNLSVFTMDIVQEWKSAAGITTGKLFRSLDRWNNPSESMEASRVAKIFKTVARKCGLKEEEVALISGHSTRVGAAQDLLFNGHSVAEMMQSGGWKSTEMPMRYAQKLSSKKSAMAALAKAQGKDKHYDINEPS